jgi:molybdopterin synthase sulfur carrier subunit
MAVKVRIPTPLQKLTNGKAEVECNAKNIVELVDALEKDFPGMKERLSDNGRIRRFINIYVNEEDIRFMNKEETALKDGDAISIVPAIAGGREKNPKSEARNSK